MKRLSIALFLMIFTYGATLAESFKSVSNEEFEKVLSDTANVVCLDVRTPAEFESGHLPNAINIDVKDEGFSARALAILNRSNTIAVYCRSGRRSKLAGNILTANGYKVIELDKGILGWTADGKSVVK